EPGAPVQGEGNIPEDDIATIMQDAPAALRIAQDDPLVRGLVVAPGISKPRTQDYVQQFIACLGNVDSPQTQHFIGKLRTRIKDVEGNIRVGDFLNLAKRYLDQEFDPFTAQRIWGRMSQLSVNDPNFVSSERLRDDNMLNTSDLLEFLK
ncbi:MAG TPA: hypothetical protein VKD19_12705, partial [Pseudolabrys sp.]|nr:hypothetical protein [Pseudolabrys sp.]